MDALNIDTPDIPSIPPGGHSGNRPAAKKTPAWLKLLAVLLGLIGGLVVCGGLLGWTIRTGLLNEWVDRYTNQVGSQGAAVPSVSSTPEILSVLSTAAVSATSALSYEQRYEMAVDDMNEAYRQIDNLDNAAAIQAIDRVLDLIPENAEWHFMRAKEYYQLAPQTGYLNVYLDYLDKALQDVDLAITLDPQTGIITTFVIVSILTRPK